MPRRILPEVDMNILRDIGMGIKNKDIAETYDVSPSYVSKVKRGKKVLDIPIKPVVQDLDLKGTIKEQIKKYEKYLVLMKELLKIVEENDKCLKD